MGTLAQSLSVSTQLLAVNTNDVLLVSNWGTLFLLQPTEYSTALSSGDESMCCLSIIF